ncbi:unnamed protein product [Lampetra fluviatilis]
MALAQVAYPRMDDVGLDTIVLEKMLLLARELRITIHVKDEANISSLRAAHYLHTELLLQRDGQVAACATHIAAQENEVLDNQAFASQHATNWRATDRPRQDTTNDLLQTISKPNVYGRYKSVGEILYLNEELLEMLAMLSVCWPVRRKDIVASSWVGRRPSTGVVNPSRFSAGSPLRRGSPLLLVRFALVPRRFSRQIYEAGAVAPLVHILRKGRSVEKLHAVTTLSRLSRDPGTCSQMRQVAAQTLVSNNQEPFIQVLNVGLDTSIIHPGAVLARRT